ncbi:hypothetical protein LOY70_19445 [Pseudomonas sp. B21-054]|uniref:hypothetical protein n=1 Tax=Pseudomonas sp. B21-054 TaxID=2895494 RepID=UPI0022306AA7|nr:hypothetical protein [Pseudomonas sp. B21-054]UZE16066.1 hypothetical protein LOY70_19445 [Pseudomonas sp. B21-054]
MMRLSKTRIVIAHLVLWGVILGLAFIVVGLLTLEAANDLNGWYSWLDKNKTALLIWRLTLYGATAVAWYRMRQRLARRGLTTEQHRRLLCAEVTAMGVLTLLELLAVTDESRPWTRP